MMYSKVALNERTSVNRNISILEGRKMAAFWDSKQLAKSLAYRDSPVKPGAQISKHLEIILNFYGCPIE